MKRTIFVALVVLAFFSVVVNPPMTAGEPAKSPAPNPAESTKNAETCPMMMQGSGTTEEGRKAMPDFMQSPKAAQAMANMMEMARRMGDGNPMLGMTKMMEMMGGGHGGMGGTMEGQAGPTTPESK